MSMGRRALMKAEHRRARHVSLSIGHGYTF
jgi:hypothetical protein